MFQPETEDMLPRMAPKPSGVGGEGLIRPQVPEISILFGQQDANVVTQNVTQQQYANNVRPQPSYAAWKKQMLPKVNYIPSANRADVQVTENVNNNNMILDYNAPRANLYPLRSSTAAAANMAPNVAANGFAQTQNGQTNPLTYRRSMESCNNIMYQQQMQHLPATMSQSQTPLQTIKPLTSPMTNPTSRDVLTICAGTQTDAGLDSSNNYLLSGPWSNLASKQDVEDMRLMLEAMQQEQQRIAKMLETLLFNPLTQFAVNRPSQDIGVQTDCIETDNLPSTNGDVLASKQDQYDIAQQVVAQNKFLQHLKPSNNTLQTPKGKPMAQSTTYRPNSPQTLRFQQEQLHEVVSAPTYQQVSCGKPPAAGMHKSASDTSLAMNELALKYLPNEKLAELLNELNMDCPATVVTTKTLPTTPVRSNVEQFEKGPSDISNASYKYLKKYRLLPEDRDEVDENANEGVGVEGEMMANVHENQLPMYSSPQQQYNNNIRSNTPLNQRQTPTNKCSPYAGRLPLSPLARGTATPPLQSAQNLVNLDNIKQQPKFL